LPRSAPDPHQARVIIAAGGTAGHVKPALAIADALRADGALVSFIGTGKGSGAGLVAATGIEEDVIPMSGIERRLTLRNFRSVGLAVLAVPRAVRAIRRRRAQVVIGGGGYVAGPVALAAWVLRATGQGGSCHQIDYRGAGPTVRTPSGWRRTASPQQVWR